MTALAFISSAAVLWLVVAKLANGTAAEDEPPSPNNDEEDEAPTEGNDSGLASPSALTSRAAAKEMKSGQQI